MPHEACRWQQTPEAALQDSGDAWDRRPARAVGWSGPTELGEAGKEAGIPRVPVCPVLGKMCLLESKPLTFLS